MGQAVEQRGRHFWIAEHARPFAEGKIGGDNDRGSFVEPADEMEQQLPAGLSEGQIAEFVEDDEVEAREVIGEPTLAASARLSLELIDEIDGGERENTLVLVAKVQRRFAAGYRLRQDN